MNAITTKLLVCDYLVVGAGAASIAFIDTLLTHLPTTTIVLVDKNPIPGGHWVHAYGYVHLHQPSLLYGVASRQLEGNWAKLLLRKFTLPWNHRASKNEILHHYATYIQDKVDAGKIQYYPNCEYQFSEESTNTVDDNYLHSFSNLDGSMKYSVQVKKKVVNGILGECIVPSTNPVNFHVDDGITILTPNQIFEEKVTLIDYSKNVKKHFVVLGCGKTAMDTLVYLQRDMNVQPDQISWIIPNDVWMMLRSGSGSPWSWPEALLRSRMDENEAALSLERKGIFARLDTNIVPTKFRFPLVGKDELQYMRQVKNCIRRGRVTNITKNSESGRMVVKFGSDQEPWSPEILSTELVLVHCTSPGPFNGNENTDVFASDQQLNLNILFPPPIPFSMSILAFLEAARINNTLDMAFARKLCPGENKSDNEVLRTLITALSFADGNAGNPIKSMLTLAVILAIGNKDPMVVYNFIKQNRLSIFNIPGSKIGVYETLGLMLEQAKEFEFTNDTRMMQLLRQKLQLLEGK